MAHSHEQPKVSEFYKVEAFVGQSGEHIERRVYSRRDADWRETTEYYGFVVVPIPCVMDGGTQTIRQEVSFRIPYAHLVDDMATVFEMYHEHLYSNHEEIAKTAASRIQSRVDSGADRTLVPA